MFAGSIVAQTTAKPDTYCRTSSISSWSEHTLPYTLGYFDRDAKNKLATELYVEDGELKIRAKPYKRNQGTELPFSLEPFKNQIREYNGTHYALEVADGYLVSFTDYNGDLWWFDKKGEKGYQVCKKDVWSLEIIDNEVYALYNEWQKGGGIVNIIHTIEGEWIEGQEWGFDEKIRCHALLDKAMFFVTGNSLRRFGKLTEDRYFIASMFVLNLPFSWSSDIPSSMIFYEDSVYIAVLGGVFKICDIVPRLIKMKDVRNFGFRDEYWSIKWLQHDW